MQSTFIVIITLSIVRLWIAGQLLATGRKFNLTNLYWLAAWSLTVATYVIFAPVTPPTAFSLPAVYYFGTLAGQFLLVMFMHKTFYQEKSSPVGVFIAIIIAAGFAVFYLVWTGNNESAGLVSQTVTLINWGWHSVLAWQAYQLIRNESGVERWIKGRYQLMIAYCVIIFAGNLIIMPLSTSLARSLPAFVTQVGAGINLVGTILLFLVWVMPEPLRVWLNRHETPAAKTDETIDSRAIMSIIAEAIMAKSHINQTACFYILRQVVAKTIPDKDTSSIDKHMAEMTYADWQELIRSQEMRETISNFVALDAIEPALNNARLALIEKQSLFTLGAK